MPNQQSFVAPDPDRDPGGFVNLLAGSPPASVALPGQSQPSSDSGLPGGGAAGLHVPAHRHQQEHLPAKIEDILNLAAAVFGEASTQRNAKEEQAIANTIMNIREASGNSASVTEFLKKHRHVIQGYHPHSGFMTAMRTRLQGGHFPADPVRDNAIRSCLDAAIKALQRNQTVDDNKAYFWYSLKPFQDTVLSQMPNVKGHHTITSSALNLYQQGISIPTGITAEDGGKNVQLLSSENPDYWKKDKNGKRILENGKPVANDQEYQYTWDVTSVEGGTVFYRYNKKYQEVTRYPRNWP